MATRTEVSIQVWLTEVDDDGTRRRVDGRSAFVKEDADLKDTSALAEDVAWAARMMTLRLVEERDA